jgi:hypothetical protein
VDDDEKVYTHLGERGIKLRERACMGSDEDDLSHLHGVRERLTMCIAPASSQADYILFYFLSRSSSQTHTCAGAQQISSKELRFLHCQPFLALNCDVGNSSAVIKSGNTLML